MSKGYKNLDFYKAGRDLSYHAYTLWLFTASDFKAIIALGYLFGIISTLENFDFGFDGRVYFSDILYRTPLMLLWSWAQLLISCLLNQRHSGAIAEDAINKPWRPIPAGRISPENATHILYCGVPLQVLYSYFVGGLGLCIAEFFFVVWYNVFGGDENPLIRNVLNAIGIGCFYGGPVEIVHGNISLLSSTKTTSWLMIVALTIAITVHVQDFRDVIGDKQRGRRTIPIVYGNRLARLSIVVGTILCSCSAPLFWKLGPAGFSLPVISGLLMICNLLWNQTLEGDNLSWKLWALWMLSFLTLPVCSHFH